MSTVDREAGHGDNGRSPDAVAVTSAARDSSSLTHHDLDRLERPLTTLRARARALLVAHRITMIFATLIAAAFVMGVLDYFLRLPIYLRATNWALGFAGVVLAIIRYVRPAWLFNPSLTDIALRVERGHPELAGRLASALDFARSAQQGGSSSDTSASVALASTVVRKVESSWRASDATGLLQPRTAWRAMGLAMLAALVAAAPMLVSAQLWRTGAERVVMPWTGLRWPSRTAVLDITNLEVHPAGRALPLRAAVTRTDKSWDRTDVTVRYRLLNDGAVADTGRELLTWQKRDAFPEIPTQPGQLFERLLEPEADAIEYRFETSDDQTDWVHVDLIPPPAVVSASVIITPPAYASQLAQQSSPDSAGATTSAIDLGPGTDDRATAPASLAGSRIELTINLSKPARIAGEQLDAIRTMDPSAVVSKSSATSNTIRASFQLNESIRLPVALLDEHGIASVDEAVYHFEATPDRAPAATIVNPPSDRGVLASATVDVVAEGRDDVGLAWASIEQRLARPAGRPEGEPSGPGGAMEEGPAAEIARTEARGTPTVQATVKLELATLGLKAGDEVRLIAIAADVLGIETSQREPTRSAVRTLRILSESEFVEELRGQLAEVRQSAQRIDAQQATLQDRVNERGADRNARKGQASVSDRVARQSESVQRLVDRVRENNLADQGLADLLAEVGTRLTDAGKASTGATSKLEQSASQAGEQPEGEQASTLKPEEAQAITQDQQKVREELAQVVEMLDRGEDAWVVRNTLERLAREQRDLAQQTQNAGQRTAGRSADQLSAQERSELQRIVERQNQLAEQARQLTEQMRQREEALRQSDPVTAAGMAAAAARAEQMQVSQTMQEAAKQAAQNQTTSAQQNQEQAAKALEQMLEDLESGERSRDAVLRRALKPIIEALRQLVAQQTTELRKLAQSEQAGDFAGLDQPMIELNTNTLGVADAAVKAGQATMPLAAIINRAADAQGRAIKALRATPTDAPAAREHENTSLDHLKQALERAEKLDEQAADREQEKKRTELKRAYREALELQTALRTETAPYAEVAELSRRDRVMVRRLSERQTAIRDLLTQLVKDTAELAEAKVFTFAHQRLDAVTSRAAAALDNADARAALPEEDSSINALKALIEALGDAKRDRKFSNQEQQEQSGGGGGGGGQKEPLIPPARELKLLRSLQADIYEQTVAIENTPGSTPRDRLSEIANLQRDVAGLADDLLKRMQSGGQPEKTFPGLDEPAGDGGPPPPPEGEHPLDVAPDEPPATTPGYAPMSTQVLARLAPEDEKAKPADSKPAQSGDDELGSLDEALGLPEGKKTDDATPADKVATPEENELEEKLSDAEVQDKFIQAVRQMSETADRLDKVRDTGAVTQRLQQDIMRKLDTLINEMQRRESQSSSSSSSRSQQQQQQQQQSQQPGQQQQQQQSQSEQAATAAGGGNPPFREGQREHLSSVRAAWGALPERLREMFMEGMDDYYSKLYESMTESYYRKAAESASDGQ